MIDSIKKNSLEFFNTNGLPNKKLENWKFTSSKNFKNFSKSSSSIDGIQKIKSDELSIVFVNGTLDKDSLKSFKYSHLLEVKNLNELNSKKLLHCSKNFFNETMFNLGMSEFENGSYLSFKIIQLLKMLLTLKIIFLKMRKTKGYPHSIFFISMKDQKFL